MYVPLIASVDEPAALPEIREVGHTPNECPVFHDAICTLAKDARGAVPGFLRWHTPLGVISGDDLTGDEFFTILSRLVVHLGHDGEEFSRQLDRVRDTLTHEEAEELWSAAFSHTAAMAEVAFIFGVVCGQVGVPPLGLSEQR